jgi:hypothetical protein
MTSPGAQFLRLSVGLCGLIVLGWVLTGEAAKPTKHNAPITTDWSNRHLIFSRPSSAEQFARISEDPRYSQQIQRREQALMLPRRFGDVDISATSLLVVNWRSKKLRRDWSENLGIGASARAGNYPAKFSFRGSTANCDDAVIPDYVVYSTGLTGSPTQASLVALDNLYSGCSKVNLGTAANFAVLGSSTVTNAGNTVVTGANIGISPGTSLTGFPPGVLTAPAVKHLGDPVASQAQADANTAYASYQGLTGAASIASLDGLTLAPGLYRPAAASLALNAGATVTLSGNGTYIFQIGSTLNLAGTVILAGGATAGNVIWLVGSSATLEGTAVAVGDIVALSSITLDSGASLVGRAIALNGAVTLIANAITTVGTVPSVYWAYNTLGQVLTSPLISLDGSQIALVQSDAGRVGTLVLIRWAASTGTVGSPVTPTTVLPSAYIGCTAPCMTTIVLHDGSNSITDDTTSSVFYDYSRDIGWVGGARGWLHKITGVFKGVPTEVHAGGFPVHVSTATLSSPVFDSVSRNVFVGDFAGFLYSVDSTNPATVIQSAQLDFGAGIVEGPVVDSANRSVYVFASSDGTTNCTFGTSACAAVYQLSTGFTNADPGSPATAGTSVASGLTPNPMYIGAFDDAYYGSSDGTGDLYVCGNTGQNPVIYQIPISGGVPIGSGAALVALVSASFSPACSPVADVVNPNLTGGTTERLYASVQNNGVATACGNTGCVLNLMVTPWHALMAYHVGQQVLDIHLNIEEVTQTGTSATSIPAFVATPGAVKTDGSVHWVNQGGLSATPLAIWTAATTQNKAGNRIVDSNGNIEVVTKTGATGGSVPLWKTGPGGATTSDGTVNWINAGGSPVTALPAAGGASGIIIDNVLNGSLAGTSQVYFTTLSDQVCGTSGTGGCAVQASQSGLN